MLDVGMSIGPFVGGITTEKNRRKISLYGWFLYGSNYHNYFNYQKRKN
ncbi:MAG: hypothetical protein N3E48_02975 [Candidatus Bathyarchaeota archaeon]|nr:hypothetical protein [Candidatus Bathyarchaeota archaeon]